MDCNLESICLSIMNLIHFSCIFNSCSFPCRKISRRKYDEIRKIMGGGAEPNLYGVLICIFLEFLLIRTERTIYFPPLDSHYYGL
jgi:hypothetical protein